ncbi:MAG: twin-arginine translocation protein TatA [Bacilli bacterium]|nr:twin-arginine translocation protein TatA [Bacilli bacterium]
MTDQKKQPFHSAEQELAALGLYAPAGSEPQHKVSLPTPPDASPSAHTRLTAEDSSNQEEPGKQPQEALPDEIVQMAELPVVLEEDQMDELWDQSISTADAAREEPARQEVPVRAEASAPQEVPARREEADPLSVRDRALSIVDHLTDLRKRLILSLVAFVIFLILSLFFVNKIYLFLTTPLGMKLTVLGPAEIIHVYFMIGGLAALVPTIPFVMWQVWLFVAPGLTARERRVTLTYIPAVFLVFIVGLLFGRFLVFPSLLRVLYGFSTQYTNYLPTADSYFSFMVRLLVPFGFIFEMPIIILFLTRLGILNPMRLIKFRKYAYFFIVLVSFMLTPPEITSHLSLTVPMILLYELSIQISKYAYKRRLRVQQERDSA